MCCAIGCCTLQASGHDNVVALLGVVTVGTPVMLLVSYCEHGSLLGQLRNRAQRLDHFSVVAKLQYGVQLCRGMAYLASKRIVHRDLAARNVLLDVDWTCKIADFGLSRETHLSLKAEGADGDGYYRSQNGLFPIRWTAPEAMRCFKFSQASDCWAWAITMAEIFQDGERPYKDVDNTNAIPFMIERGDRIPHADLHECSVAMYGVLVQCWQVEPSTRPTFAALVQLVQDEQDVSAMHSHRSSRSTSVSTHLPACEYSAQHSNISGRHSEQQACAGSLVYSNARRPPIPSSNRSNSSSNNSQRQSEAQLKVRDRVSRTLAPRPEASEGGFLSFVDSAAVGGTYTHSGEGDGSAGRKTETVV